MATENRSIENLRESNDKLLSHLSEALQLILTYPTEQAPNLALRFFEEQKANPTLFRTTDMNKRLETEKKDLVIPVLTDNERKYFQVENFRGRALASPYYTTDDNKRYQDWHKPEYFRDQGKYSTTEDMETKALDHMVNRVYFQAISDIYASIGNMCKEIDCAYRFPDQHPVKVEPGEYDPYDNSLKSVIRRTLLDAEITDWIRSQLLEHTQDVVGKFIGSIAVNDPRAVVNANLRSAVEKAHEHIEDLMESNPGVVGVWLYSTLHTMDDSRDSYRFVKGAVSELKWTDVERPGDIINLVSTALGLTPRTLAWKKLVKMPADKAYTQLSRMSRRWEASTFELRVLSARLQLQAVSVDNYNLQSLKKVETALGDDLSNWASYIPLHREYLRMSSLPTRERGMTLKDLHDEFSVISDWAKETVRVQVENKTDPEQKVTLSRKKWNGFRKASAQWHREITMSSTFSKRLAEIGQKGNIRSWVSLVESHEDGKFSVTPLTDESALLREGHRANNCVGGEGYVSSCVSGKSRIFSIMEVKKRTEAGDQVKHLATVQIGKGYQGNHWYVRQVQGHRNTRVGDTIRAVAENISKRYTEAFRLTI